MSFRLVHSLAWIVCAASVHCPVSALAADPQPEEAASVPADRPLRPKLQVAAWTGACLGVATLVTAGVFAVEARQEAERLDAYPSEAFDERFQGRRTAAIAFAAISGAAWIATGLFGVLARRAKKSSFGHEPRVALSAAWSGGAFSMHF
ncbi:MAG: hypothetical protein MUC50_00545 [Myxococcota bacterium]|jgi:hypothetical protein|nr:hypothetical protein [Myxococcota bacterium]